MAKRRVGGLLGLAILATIVERPMHPYEMASVMRARGKDEDMQIRWGSLYTVVHNLAKQGFAEAVASERHRGRPERTVYAITEAGRHELVDWVAELISTPETEPTHFVAGLSVAAILSPQQLTDLLDQRWQRLDERLTRQRDRLAEHAATVPRLFLIEAEYAIAMLQSEADWVAAFRHELRNGTFPDLPAWAHWHDTGEFPAEMAELLERGHLSNEE
jgi:DNA-binding PadR family transcriptional regulator